MEEILIRLTVYFDDPFWAAVCECEDGRKMQAAKIIFGAEPKDAEVYAYFLSHWPSFSPAVSLARKVHKPHNPKRAQREAARQLEMGLGTKAQQALRLQYEQNKQERKAMRQKEAEEQKQRQFALRQQKRKQKHRGH